MVVVGLWAWKRKGSEGSLSLSHTFLFVGCRTAKGEPLQWAEVDMLLSCNYGKRPTKPNLEKEKENGCFRPVGGATWQKLAFSDMWKYNPAENSRRIRKKGGGEGKNSQKKIQTTTAKNPSCLKRVNNKKNLKKKKKKKKKDKCASLCTSQKGEITNERKKLNKMWMSLALRTSNTFFQDKTPWQLSREGGRSVGLPHTHSLSSRRAGVAR